MHTSRQVSLVEQIKRVLIFQISWKFKVFLRKGGSASKSNTRKRKNSVFGEMISKFEGKIRGNGDLFAVGGCPKAEPWIGKKRYEKSSLVPEK